MAGRLTSLGAVVVLLGVTLLPIAGARAESSALEYSGTGGLLLPAPVPDALRAAVADCASCEWRLAQPCVRSSAGNPFSGTPECLPTNVGCSAETDRMRAWYRHAGKPWIDLGIVCIDKAGPTTVAEIRARVVVAMPPRLPKPQPEFQPTHGVVAQLPVVFSAGQPDGAFVSRVDVGEHRVEVQARPAWTWNFGDGVILGTIRAGGAFPNTAVSHAYRKARSYEVTVDAAWTVVFQVDGFGPYRVRDAVIQTATTRVVVGEGRAVLTTR